MTDPRAAAKRDAAVRAVEAVRSGDVVGLGTGSTAAFAIEELGRRIAAGALRDIVGIPTSNASHHLALEWGVPLTTLERHPKLDVTIDGADEIDPVGRVLKGGGGALLREKIVATRSARWILVIDQSKLVPHLGARYPLPVEVVTFGWQAHEDALRAMGADCALRVGDGEHPFVTDEGHYVIDARFPNGIADPEAMHRELRARPGVVDTGLFLGLSSEIVVGVESRGSVLL
ncbi:MAG TPA: ribose 5-phosphate isomerase A [Gemmatimonadaceae bacterium]|nr:ribose 5-phosphate isomerase A [Gemmatimonadaceae bacterium]